MSKWLIARHHNDILFLWEEHMYNTLSIYSFHIKTCVFLFTRHNVCILHRFNGDIFYFLILMGQRLKLLSWCATLIFKTIFKGFRLVNYKWISLHSFLILHSYTLTLLLKSVNSLKTDQTTNLIVTHFIYLIAVACCLLS